MLDTIRKESKPSCHRPEYTFPEPGTIADKAAAINGDLRGRLCPFSNKLLCFMPKGASNRSKSDIGNKAESQFN